MPPSNKRVPAIRFSCFVEEWKENKVADLAERFYGGGTPSTIASEYWGGETAWIQSSDLGEGELFNVVPKRKVTLKALKETNIQLIPANSIAVVTRVGVGKLALMEYSYTTSQDFCSLANLRVNPAMLSYLLYLELNYKGVSVQGTAIKGITKNDLDSINLFIPDGRSEQARIGQFFRTLDKLIELRKKKLDKLIALKKELLNKLFPQQGQKIPAIRFSCFVEEWKEVTFASVVEIQASKEFIADPVEGGKYPVIQQGEEPIAGYSDKQPYKEFDSSILFGDHTLSLFKPNTPFLIATDGVKIFQAKEIDSNYLFHELLIKRPASQGYKRHLNILKGVALIISRNLTEQARIGQFFRTLDKLIELRKKEVDKMIALKKELLNKLFVG